MLSVLLRPEFCHLVKGSRHFNSQGYIMAVSDAHVFPGFLTPVLTQLSFQSHFPHMLQQR